MVTIVKSPDSIRQNKLPPNWSVKPSTKKQKKTYGLPIHMSFSTKISFFLLETKKKNQNGTGSTEEEEEPQGTIMNMNDDRKNKRRRKRKANKKHKKKAIGR